ncbi:helix-turn-helix domain-containing protein [Pectobacterium brasiliense]|uniref:helix-turn-helix domain-containing protein n=1 Tax=Pectobacterium brasiliense TaxID=180957 RepID=UPI002A7F55DC|nr:helix-turn-helix domain-containing protein [Pectobacterium brasiliense]MDY4380916.1 helix-turn-helix domain-containing protein [Pectobacterium brasiliense]
MSSKLTSHVWEACAANGIKNTKLLIMVRLADYSNDDGISYPSVETIARQLGAGESTIRGAMAELEEAGWLYREGRRKGNRNTSNLYYLNAERLEDVALREIAKVKAARLVKRVSNSHPPESDGSKSDPLKSGGSNGFHPPESGAKACFDPPESGGDPQVNSKHDPQVNSKHESQGSPARKIALKSPLAGLDFSAFPTLPSGQVWGDYVKHRNAKRAPITQTVVNILGQELTKAANAGWTVDQALGEAMAAGWQGLKFEWLANRNQAVRNAAPLNKQEALEARNAQAFEEWLQEEAQALENRGDIDGRY